MRNDVLICEISGKRPGGVKERTTEGYPTNFPKVIISNESTGYETEWQIINVPEDYQKWYIENHKIDDKAYYAPMNRSYAIKYAKEHGYKYCIQLDDNIKLLEINYLIDEVSYKKKYNNFFASGTDQYILDDLINILCTVLDNTDAGMCGMNLAALCPTDEVLKERYVYSFFALKLDVVPEVFQGGFEDDIEYKLKLTQMGIPTLQLPFLRYSKNGVGGGKDFKDTSGCRQAYKDVGVHRGDKMRVLYGETYSAGTTNKAISTNTKAGSCPGRFKHKIKPTKVGAKIYDKEKIEYSIKELLEKYAKQKEDKIKVKEVAKC